MEAKEALSEQILGKMVTLKNVSLEKVLCLLHFWGVV
jgi:hypothetical protein